MVRKPLGFLRSFLSYHLRFKVTFAGKKVKEQKKRWDEPITLVRSVNYVPRIKYVENNLVFNQEGECFAYYELVPYNYSFLSPEQKYQVHDNFRQLIAQNREGKIHALQIATESSIRATQERSKKEITGRLKEVAKQRI